MQSRRTAIAARTIGCTAVLSLAYLAGTAEPQQFSEWNQATGFKRVEYRWRQNDTRGCEVEYRNLDGTDKRKYKSRIVFQIDGDEHEKPYTIVSFADPAPHLDEVSVCTRVTDVSVTRF